MQRNTNWKEKKIEKKFLPRITRANELKDSISIKEINKKIGEEVSINHWLGKESALIRENFFYTI